MARITIEDCIDKVPNRFHLVQMTAIRAKQLKRGAASLVQAEENKEVVTALREIAAGLVSPDYPDEASPAAEVEFAPPEAGLGEQIVSPSESSEVPASSESHEAAEPLEPVAPTDALGAGEPLRQEPVEGRSSDS